MDSIVYGAVSAAVTALVTVVVTTVTTKVINKIHFKRNREAAHDDQALRQLGELESDTECGGRDTTKYSLDGVGNYGKGRLVFEVIRRYVEKHPGVTYEELQNEFPPMLRGLKRKTFWGCFNKIVDAKRLETETGIKRHFLKDGDIIRLSDGADVVVSSQWGIGNIDQFIIHARELGFVVAAVK